MKLLTTALTDVGRIRAANEDAFVVDDDAHMLAVADGMGGHQAGEVASATAIAALQSRLKEGRAIDEAIVDANTAIVERASGDPGLRGMGTTLTAAVFDDDHVLVIGHVGDSRAYLLRDGGFEQLTVDHSVVAELIAAGQLTEAEAEIDPRRAMVTRALGIDVDVDVDVINVNLAVGDRLLFCSDGLTTMVRDDAIADVLRTETDRTRAAQELVEAANSAGGADNITVVLVDVVDDDATIELAPRAPEPEPIADDVDADTLDLEAEPEPETPPPPAEDLDVELDEPPAHPVRKRHWWQRRTPS
jgi:serine/threonine protein phosphatase PrpC